MPFSTAGLDALVTDLKAKIAATNMVPLSARQAFVIGYAQGANYALPLDHTTLVALDTLLNTPANVTNALALQDAADAAIATDTANDATRTAANTTDETAETNTAAARDAFTPV